jgi:hypothetical protein
MCMPVLTFGNISGCVEVIPKWHKAVGVQPVNVRALNIMNPRAKGVGAYFLASRGF